MPPIKINTYNFNLSSYENLKSNFLADRLAKNRWGKKFSRLYQAHDTSEYVNEVPVVSPYYFTAGMRASVMNLDEYTIELQKTNAFKSSLLNNIKVNTSGVWSEEDAKTHSFMTVLLENVSTGFLDDINVKGLGFSLSIAEAGGDGRKLSWFHKSGTQNGTLSELNPIYADETGVRLVGADGAAYGHYDGGLRAGTAQNSALSFYGIEDKTNAAFATDQTSRFLSIWDDLMAFLKLMLRGSSTEYIDTSVVIGLHQFLDWIDSRILTLEESIFLLENDEGRIGDDLDLIDHLDLGENLSTQITDPSEIKNIYFFFRKEITPPVGGDEGSPPDQNYEWWKEEQFAGKEVEGVYIPGIADYVKDFQDLCEVSWGNSSSSLGHQPSYVYVKKEAFDKAGWKIYWLVSAFLDIEVEMKEPSWWEKLLKFFLLVIAIVLTVVSSNPIWLKMILIITTIGNHFGVIPPEMLLAVAVISMGYGLYSVDFASLSGMQMFEFAIKNISMASKIVGMYEAIGVQEKLDKDAKAEQEDKTMAQLQEEAMNFIYSTAYSQYDSIYGMLYDFEPKYKF